MSGNWLATHDRLWVRSARRLDGAGPQRSNPSKWPARPPGLLRSLTRPACPDPVGPWRREDLRGRTPRRCRGGPSSPGRSDGGRARTHPGLDPRFGRHAHGRLRLSPCAPAMIATDDLEAVLDADAVLVVMSEHLGRGMFVELGAALTRAHRGELEHLVVLGPIKHESVFYFHPAVQRMLTVEEW